MYVLNFYIVDYYITCSFCILKVSSRSMSIYTQIAMFWWWQIKSPILPRVPKWGQWLRDSMPGWLTDHF